MPPIQRLTAMLIDANPIRATMAMAAMILMGCSAVSSAGIDMAGGGLAPCPDSPNCVSSQSGDPRHHVDPITYTGQRNRARRILEQTVADMPGARIVNRSDQTLHVEYQTRWLRFVDDVTFYFPEEPIIHVRSASRKGYYDFGVNRKRVEEIRKRFKDRIGRKGRN